MAVCLHLTHLGAAEEFVEEQEDNEWLTSEAVFLFENHESIVPPEYAIPYEQTATSCDQSLLDPASRRLQIALTAEQEKR